MRCFGAGRFVRTWLAYITAILTTQRPSRLSYDKRRVGNAIQAAHHNITVATMAKDVIDHSTTTLERRLKSIEERLDILSRDIEALRRKDDADGKEADTG